MIRFALYAFVALAVLTAAVPASRAQDTEADLDQAPVVIDGRTIMALRGVAGLSAGQRAETIEERILALARYREACTREQVLRGLRATAAVTGGLVPALARGAEPQAGAVMRAGVAGDLARLRAPASPPPRRRAGASTDRSAGPRARAPAPR